MNITNIVAIVLIVISSMGCVMASEESENLLTIQKEIIIDEVDWIAGITSVSGLTVSEKRRLTMPDPIPEPDGEIISAPLRRLLADERFDWRDEGAMTPVKSQGSCGSCWAFPPVATIESKVLIDSGAMLDLSEQHLVSKCCRAGDCRGGYPSGALNYIKENGVPNEACYPYTAKSDACNPCPGWEDRAWKIEDFIYINSSIDDFKWALKEYGPMTVVVKVPDDWYYYRSGVYEPVTDVGWANHAVLLTGWDDSDGCWFIKNSWGTGWGEEGYARVKYGDLEQYNYAYAISDVIDPGASPDGGEWIKPVDATASSSHDERYTPEKAIDNDTGTYWFSKHNPTPPCWIQFDLGEPKTIDKVRTMVYRADVPMIVEIQTSIDEMNWKTVANQTIEEHGEFVDIPFAKTKCGYIKMIETSLPRGYAMCTEFDVWVIEEEEEPAYALLLEIVYTDRIEMIGLDDDVMNITLFQNDTPIWKWWGLMDGGD